jgi:ABC-type glycerol-3-phosphate transport system substrate-binding protein
MKLRPFELGLVVVFIGLIVVSLIVLSAYKKSPDSDGPVIGSVTIWGVLPQDAIKPVIDALIEADEAYAKVKYYSVPAESFNDELVNALADGGGPDAILLSSEQIVEMRKRIKPLSYESFPLRDVKNVYVDGADIFALSDGLYAYPIAVDPLVMYYNKDLITTDGFLEAPATWEALVNDYLPTLIRRSPDRSIERSVLAFGEYGNAEHGFGVISMLLIQAGSRGVSDEEGMKYHINLNTPFEGSSRPLEVVADFYTRFSKPTNSLYSWNRSFSSDLDRFISGDLVFYFGYASEGVDIERRNPNLNFDVSEVPQGAAATVRRTYGRFYGFSVLRTSDNSAGAASIIKILSSKEQSEKIVSAARMAPTLKSSLAAGSNDIYGRVAYKSASIAYAWLNPNITQSNAIFKTMTEDINENRSSVTNATGDVIDRLELEYN